MLNLSERVKKAKKLVFSHSPRRSSHWGTRGSRGKDYGEKYYHITLSHQRETITTPDDEKTISVFVVNCQKDTGNGRPCNCPDVKYNHAICKHSLGAIYRSFESAETKRLVSFFESYESAFQMRFGGKIAKIRSANGTGVAWCVVKDWPEPKPSSILSVEENITLMRGSEDEGID